MDVYRSSNFEKRYKKLPATVRTNVDQRLLLFSHSPFYPLLHNHPLHGSESDKRSINASGDYRIIYKLIAPDTCLLVDIGTHSELYGK